jgi:phage N-6-adenine-methyltransferase
MSEDRSHAYMEKAKTQSWGTPLKLIEELGSKWGNVNKSFDLDVAASAELHVCPTFYDEEVNGLAQPWMGICFMNPPYGRCEIAWVRKAVEEVSCGNAIRVVALLPAKVGKDWWAECIVDKTSANGIIGLRYPVRHVEFIRGRVCYINGVQPKGTVAPFPSVVIVFEDYVRDIVDSMHAGRMDAPVKRRRPRASHCSIRSKTTVLSLQEFERTGSSRVTER